MHRCCSFRAPFQRAWKERRWLFASILCIVRRRPFSYYLSHVFISTFNFPGIWSFCSPLKQCSEHLWRWNWNFRLVLIFIEHSPSLALPVLVASSLLRRLFSSPPAVSTGILPGGSWGSDSSSSGVKEGKTTLKWGEKEESKGKIDRKDNVRRIRQKRVTPSTLVDRAMDSNDRQMGFGGAWTETVIEKQDSSDAFSVIVTPQLYSKISSHSFTTRNTIQLKVLQLISLLDCIRDKAHLWGI